MDILIVEDEPIIAISLAVVLESAGHTIIGPVRTRLEAVELCRKQRPTIALLDINLEGRFDGIELARSLQQQGIPSVFLSAQHAQALANRDAALGFIAKPYTAANVCDSLEIVAAMLAGRAPPAQTGVLEVFR
jgi:CheY-like chemotaxis protein